MDPLGVVGYGSADHPPNPASHAVRVRPATPDDLDAVRGVFRRSALHWDVDRAWLLANPRHLEWNGALARTRVAVLDRIVGFAAWSPRDDGWELDDLFVDPGAMRKGVGRALVADLLAIARQAGVPDLWVTGNPDALPFYLAVGFVRVGFAPTERNPAPRLRLTV